MDVGIGFREHTGWAIVAAAGWQDGAPVLIHRERVLLCPPELPRQVYHEVEHRPAAEAERAIPTVREAALGHARVAISSMAQRVTSAGHTVAGVGVSIGRQALPELAQIFRSHSLLHAAEGELYRDVLVEAAESEGYPVVRFRPAEVFERAAEVLDIPPWALEEALKELGKTAGRPWQKDHREAVAAALIALSAKADGYSAAAATSR